MSNFDECKNILFKVYDKMLVSNSGNDATSKLIRQAIRIATECIKPTTSTHPSTLPPSSPSDISEELLVNTVLYPFHLLCLHSKPGKLPECVFEGLQAIFGSNVIPPQTLFKPPHIVVPKEESGGIFSKIFPSSKDKNQQSSPAASEVPVEAEVSPTATPTTTVSASNNAAVETAPSYLLDALVSDLLPVAQWNNEVLQLALIPCLQNACCPPYSHVLALHKGMIQQVLHALLSLFIISKVPSIQSSAKNAIGEICSHSAIQMEYLDPTDPQLAANDVVRILSYLCQLSIPSTKDTQSGSPTVSASMKSGSGGGFEREFLDTFPAMDFKADNGNKCTLLGLTFMFKLLCNAGPSFRRNSFVVQRLKSTLMPTLFSCAFCTDYEVYKLTIRLFLFVSVDYLDSLLEEIGAFYVHVLFNILDAKTSSMQQRLIVVEALVKVSEEPKNLIDLFLNYDCVSDRVSIFEQIVVRLRGIIIGVGEETALVVKDGEKGGHQRQRSTSAGTNAGASNNGSGSVSATGNSNSATDDNASVKERSIAALLRIVQAFDQWIDRFADTIPLQQAQEDTSLGSNSDPTPPDAAAEKWLSEENRTTASTTTTFALSDVNTQDFVKEHKMKQTLNQIFSLMNQQMNMKAAVQFMLDREEVVMHVESYGQELLQEGKDGSPKNHELNSSFQQQRGPSESQVLDEGEEGGWGENPKRVALFLKKYEDFISKVAIGEYFSKLSQKPFHKHVLKWWLELHDFWGLELDEALRRFLGGFKLVGEADIVDKTMELFAQHYCNQNPGRFSSAGTAFILAFSICMLNTDAHSAHVKDKMTKEQFVSNNRGIDDGGDVPQEVLSGIYDRVVKEEIKLRRSSHVEEPLPNTGIDQREASNILAKIPIFRHLAPVANAVSDVVMLPVDFASEKIFGQKRRVEAKAKEFRTILAKAMDMLARLGATSSSGADCFAAGSQLQHAIPMWDMTIEHVLAVFSQLLISNNLHDAVSQHFLMALEGVRDSLYICASFGQMDGAASLSLLLFREASIKSNIKICVDSVQLLSPFTERQARCIETLLNAFVVSGHTFDQGMWFNVFTLLSYLDAADLLEHPPKTSSTPMTPGSSSDSSGVNPFKLIRGWVTSSTPTPQTSKEKTFQQESRLAFEKAGLDIATAVTKIFDITRYPSTAHTAIVNGLCAVMERELEVQRCFSLVQLTSLMSIVINNSTRMVWREVWTSASNLFVKAGTHAAEAVSVVAVDNLHDLAFIFLGREELSQYQYQCEVLRPFVTILTESKSSATRKHVVLALSRLIQLRTTNIVSGWRVLLNGLSHAAMFPEVAMDSWKLVELILTENFHHLNQTGNFEIIREFFSCLACFACNPIDEQAGILGITALLYCAASLQVGFSPFPIPAKKMAKGVVTESPKMSGKAAIGSGPMLSCSAIETASYHHLSHVQSDPHLSRCSFPPISADDPLHYNAHQETVVSSASSLSLMARRKLWCCLWDSLLPVVISHRHSVARRMRALSVLCTILLQYGGFFELNTTWRMLTNEILIPLVRSLLRVPSDKEIQQAEDSTVGAFGGTELILNLALRSLVAIGMKHFSSEFFLSVILPVLEAGRFPYPHHSIEGKACLHAMIAQQQVFTLASHYFLTQELVTKLSGEERSQLLLLMYNQLEASLIPLPVSRLLSFTFHQAASLPQELQCLFFPELHPLSDPATLDLKQSSALTTDLWVHWVDAISTRAHHILGLFPSCSLEEKMIPSAVLQYVHLLGFGYKILRRVGPSDSEGKTVPQDAAAYHHDALAKLCIPQKKLLSDDKQEEVCSEKQSTASSFFNSQLYCIPGDYFAALFVELNQHFAQYAIFEPPSVGLSLWCPVVQTVLEQFQGLSRSGGDDMILDPRGKGKGGEETLQVSENIRRVLQRLKIKSTNDDRQPAKQNVAPSPSGLTPVELASSQYLFMSAALHPLCDGVKVLSQQRVLQSLGVPEGGAVGRKFSSILPTLVSTVPCTPCASLERQVLSPCIEHLMLLLTPAVLIGKDHQFYALDFGKGAPPVKGTTKPQEGGLMLQEKFAKVICSLIAQE